MFPKGEHDEILRVSEPHGFKKRSIDRQDASSRHDEGKTDLALEGQGINRGRDLGAADTGRTRILLRPLFSIRMIFHVRLFDRVRPTIGPYLVLPGCQPLNTNKIKSILLIRVRLNRTLGKTGTRRKS